MKTPVQKLMEYMEQNQYFIGNDLLAKYKELIDKQDVIKINNSYELLKKFKLYYDKVENNIKYSDSHDDRVVSEFITEELRNIGKNK